MGNYYHENASAYIFMTEHADMTFHYEIFKPYVRVGGSILDLGFGSGRDSLAFKKQGYDVTSLDLEESFCEHGRKIGLKNVVQMDFEQMEYDSCFDAIWACASLLHVRLENLRDVFARCARALKKGGAMYTCFKYGNYEGERDGRYFVDFDERSILPYLEQTGLTLKECYTSTDVREENMTKWLNLILIRKE